MLDDAVSHFGPNNLGQGYQPKKNPSGNNDVKGPPRNPNGNKLDTRVYFPQAIELLYRGNMVTSPSTMYKGTHLKIDIVHGNPVLYSYSQILDKDWQREALVSIPTAFLFADDWALVINLDNKK